MTLQEAVDYVTSSYADYFRLGDHVYSRVSMNWYLLDITNKKWNNGTIFECDDEGNEI